MLKEIVTAVAAVVVEGVAVAGFAAAAAAVAAALIDHQQASSEAGSYTLAT